MFSNVTRLYSALPSFLIKTDKLSHALGEQTFLCSSWHEWFWSSLNEDPRKQKADYGFWKGCIFSISLILGHIEVQIACIDMYNGSK